MGGVRDVGLPHIFFFFVKSKNCIFTKCWRKFGDDNSIWLGQRYGCMYSTQKKKNDRDFVNSFQILIETRNVLCFVVL